MSDALATALGLTDLQPITAAGNQRLDKLTTYVPVADADRVRQALAQAGAGVIGDYDSASFSTPGEGRFRPLAGANPTIGEVGALEVVDEVRIECVLARAARPRSSRRCWRRTPTRSRRTTSWSSPIPGRRRPAAAGSARSSETTLEGFARQVAERAARDGARRPGGRRSRPGRPPGGRVRGSGRLPARRGTAHRRRRLRDQRPAPPSGERVPRAGRTRARRRRALGGRVDLAASVASKVAEALGHSVGDTVETRVSTLCTDPWTVRFDDSGHTGAER